MVPGCPIAPGDVRVLAEPGLPQSHPFPSAGASESDFGAGGTVAVLGAAPRAPHTRALPLPVPRLLVAIPLGHPAAGRGHPSGHCCPAALGGPKTPRRCHGMSHSSTWCDGTRWHTVAQCHTTFRDVPPCAPGGGTSPLPPGEGKGPQPRSAKGAGSGAPPALPAGSCRVGSAS